MQVGSRASSTLSTRRLHEEDAVSRNTLNTVLDLLSALNLLGLAMDGPAPAVCAPSRERPPVSLDPETPRLGRRTLLAGGVPLRSAPSTCCFALAVGLQNGKTGYCAPLTGTRRVQQMGP